MEDRHAYIIDTAKGLFLRYGVKRTGMNDIAQAAGISRQTLYKAFANKDDVLRAMIRALADKVVLDIEAGLQKAEGLGAQLDVIFEHSVTEHYDLLQASPNAEDIVAGVTEASHKELEAGAQRNKEIIARVLAPSSQKLEACGITVDQYADFIERTSTAAKYNATSKEHLLSLLDALRVSVLKVSGSD